MDCLFQPMKFLDENITGGKFDLIFNLPMRNKFRRPASYMTTGSLTRRMAVDMGGSFVPFLALLSSRDEMVQCR